MIKFNKKLIFDKFFLENTYFFLLTISCLSIIVWIIQAVNFLDFVTEDGHGLIVYFKYTFLNLPKIISKLMPLIFFIAIFYTINQSEDNNELKIFWINGIDKKEFMSSMIKYSFLFLIIQFLLNALVVPLSQNKARTYIKSSSIDFFPSLINEKKFIDTVEKLTIYVEKKDSKNNYKNIFLKDDKADNFIRIIHASEGKLINDAEQRSLYLKNGKIININNNKITAFDFQSTTFDLTNFLTKSIVDFKIQEKSTYQIIDCYINYHLLKNENFYHIQNCNESTLVIIQQELFKRFLKPFYYIALATCACFLLLFSKENLNHKYYRLSVFILGIFILIFSELTTSLSGKNTFYFQLSFISLLLITLGQFLILYKKIKFTK